MKWNSFKKLCNTENISLELIERYGQTDFADRLKGVRKARAFKRGLYLTNEQGEESQLFVTHASLAEVTDEYLCIFEAGERPLTEEERSERDRYLTELKTYQEENPHSDSYWWSRHWFEKSSMPYLSGFESMKSTSMRYNVSSDTVIDKTLRGELILKYKIHRERT